jgi:MoaA/NifB/PqqE/SkfB family radical SAM enzyme
MRLGDRLFALTAKGAIQAGIRMLPLISDDTFLRFAHRQIATIPWQEGLEFMERLLITGKHALADANARCREKASNNFVYNYLVVGYLRRKAFRRANGFIPPYLVVISPTMECNLGCYGCYAGSYPPAELDLDTVLRVIEEGKRMGIYFIVVSGGEPFIWEHIFDLFEQEHDVYFQVYTNGSLIDRETAERISEMGNVLPCISVEGFEDETDARRGPGAFRNIIRAMDALRRCGVLFGFSATATRQNNDLIVSDAFVDFYERKGCLIGWYFNYVPVGRRPEMGLMPTPEQRIRRRRRMLELRRNRRIVLADFWNDGPLTGGCIAGGRSYLHINSNGDVEPCVFTHFAVDNIKDKSLEDVIGSDFFRSIRERIPYCDNFLRPCMLIDHPYVLRELVARYNAGPTHPGADTLLGELKDDLDRYASEYGNLADAEWYGQHGAQQCCGAGGE